MALHFRVHVQAVRRPIDVAVFDVNPCSIELAMEIVHGGDFFRRGNVHPA
jgi:hypothetical protein